MNTSLPPMPSALVPLRREPDGMRRGGVRNTVEGRRERQKIWSKSTLGFGGLQPVEIPQNGQSFVWKSLEKNTLRFGKAWRIARRPAIISPPPPPLRRAP